MVLIMVKYMLISVVSILLLLITVEAVKNTTSPHCLEISTYTEVSNNITSPNYPQTYPTGCEWEWTVDATGKSQLLVKFHSFDINNETGDQLSIKIFEGNTLYLQWTGEKEIGTELIPNEEKEIRKNWDDKGEHRLIEFVFKTIERNETNTHTGFSLEYELSSNESNTDLSKYQVENTTIDTKDAIFIQANNQNTSVTTRGYIIINLDGKTINQFSEEKEKFCGFMANLSTVFCKKQKLCSYDISNSNVYINAIYPCSEEWPKSELCISVNLSIAINNTENELTTAHLYDVWNSHSPEKLMSELGVKEYNVKEDNNFVLVLWLATTGTLFLLFLAILAVVLKTRVVENYIKRTRREHLNGYGVYERSRFAQPNQQQLVPPFFYPDEKMAINQKPLNQYGVEPLQKNTIIGQENPAFVPDNSKKRVTKQMSQEQIDDFDSDDDTIYPPSPLARQSSNRPQLAFPDNKSSHELETAF